MKIKSSRCLLVAPEWASTANVDLRNDDYELGVVVHGLGKTRNQSEQNLLAALHELRGHVDAAISRLKPRLMGHYYSELPEQTQRAVQGKSMLKRKTPMKRSRLQRGGRIKPVSAKMVTIKKMYQSLKRDFMEKHPYCQFWLAERGLSETDVKKGGVVIWIENGIAKWCHECSVPASEDIHHKRGRGKYMLDTTTWMAVSRKNHDYIHANPKESYLKGYMLPR